MTPTLEKLKDVDWKKQLPLLVLALVSLLAFLHPTIRAIRFTEVRGDSALYMSYLLSVFEDGDLELGDDYLELDPLIAVNHQNHLIKTETGHTVATFPPGPAILWSPFFLAAKGFHVITGQTDRAEMLEDFSIYCQYGTSFYSILAVFLFFFFLKRFFSPWIASVASLATLFLTPFLGYAYTMRLESHGLGVFSVVLLLWYCSRTGRERSLKQWAVLGAIAGLVFLIRWMDIIVLIWLLGEQLPLLIDAIKKKELSRDYFKKYFLFAAGFLVTILPQIVVTLVVFGFGKGPMSYGANFVEWMRPEVLNILFSSRNGLFSWHPMTFFAFAGLFLLLRKKFNWAMLSLVILALVTYLNAVTGDWWGGHAFGMRRFCSFVPFLGIGFAGVLDVVRKKWFLISCSVVFVFFGAWNLEMLGNYIVNKIPHHPTVADVNPVKVKREWVNKFGYPITWPGESIFQLCVDGVDSKQAEWLVSRQLIFCDDGLKGDVLAEYPSFQDGFSPLKRDPKGEFRQLENKGKVYLYRLGRHAANFMSVRADVVENTMRMRQTPVVKVTINGKYAGLILPTVEEDTVNSFVHTPKGLWNYGINRIELELYEGKRSLKKIPMVQLQRKHRLKEIKPANGQYKLRVRKIEFFEETPNPDAGVEVIKKGSSADKDNEWKIN